MQAVSFLLLGSLSKYKPIHVNTVARSMIAAVHHPSHGVEIYEYDEMKKIS
jgi:hypothetical protein